MLTVESAFSAWTSQNLVELAERNNAVKKGNASTLLVTIDQRYGHGNNTHYNCMSLIANTQKQ